MKKLQNVEAVMQTEMSKCHQCGEQLHMISRQLCCIAPLCPNFGIVQIDLEKITRYCEKNKINTTKLQ